MNTSPFFIYIQKITKFYYGDLCNKKKSAKLSALFFILI